MKVTPGRLHLAAVTSDFSPIVFATIGKAEDGGYEWHRIQKKKCVFCFDKTPPNFL